MELLHSLNLKLKLRTYMYLNNIFNNASLLGLNLVPMFMYLKLVDLKYDMYF